VPRAPLGGLALAKRVSGAQDRPVVGSMALGEEQMVIQISDEDVITLADATKRLPRIRGKRIHISTIYRWAHRGVGGVRLETLRVGGRLCTSAEALQRFCDALTAPRVEARGARLSRRREEEIRRAEAECDRLGI